MRQKENKFDEYVKCIYTLSVEREDCKDIEREREFVA